MAVKDKRGFDQTSYNSSKWNAEMFTIRCRPFSANKVAHRRMGLGSEGLKRRRGDFTEERVCSEHDREKERTIICALVHVLIIYVSLPGLLHEPQDLRPERVNEFHPRDIIWVLKTALEHLLVGKCKMF